MGRLYSGVCIVAPTHPALMHPDVLSANEMIDRMSMFITRYVSHLASSNDKGVDPDRLAHLQLYIAQIPK